MEEFLNKNSSYLLNSLIEGVYVIDKEFKIRFANKAAYELLNKKPEEVLGKICQSLCKSERCKIRCPITEVLRSHKNILQLESTLLKGDGNLIDVKMNVAILKDDSNNLIGGIVSFQEIKQNGFDSNSDNHNTFWGIVNRSKKMREIIQLIKEISNTYATVLITGETGVGKELIANAIQLTSQRSNAPYVKVNCASLPPTMLNSELFGHVKGSFTDAKTDRIGRFEYADGGTIFLDEIGEMPIDMQVQLLRVLQQGTFERLGNSETLKTDVRVIAATNKDIQEAIKENKFREDLYYRLNVIPIHIPPLRERKDDLLVLMEYFVKKYTKKYNKKITRIDDETIDILLNYNYPGNVRELENIIEYSVIRSKREDYLCSCCLPSNLRTNKKCRDSLTAKELEIDEKTEILLSLLRQNNWNKSKVASMLGVNRSTIYRQLKNIQKK